MYWLLQQYDAPYNSLPSLHAGLLVYTLAFGRRVVGHAVPRGLEAAVRRVGGADPVRDARDEGALRVDIVAGVGARRCWRDSMGWRRTRGGGRVAARIRRSSGRMSHGGLR